MLPAPRDRHQTDVRQSRHVLGVIDVVSIVGGIDQERPGRRGRFCVQFSDIETIEIGLRDLAPDAPLGDLLRIVE
jgi:hypothetical protein